MTVFKELGGKPFLIDSKVKESGDRHPRVDIRIDKPTVVLDPDPLVDVGIQMLNCDKV